MNRIEQRDPKPSARARALRDAPVKHGRGCHHVRRLTRDPSIAKVLRTPADATQQRRRLPGGMG